MRHGIEAFGGTDKARGEEQARDDTQEELSGGFHDAPNAVPPSRAGTID